MIRLYITAVFWFVVRHFPSLANSRGVIRYVIFTVLHWTGSAFQSHC